jgi:hypothetical protein
VLQPAGENFGNMKTEEEAWVMEKSNVISAEEERRPDSVPAVVTRTRAG